MLRLPHHFGVLVCRAIGILGLLCALSLTSPGLSTAYGESGSPPSSQAASNGCGWASLANLMWLAKADRNAQSETSKKAGGTAMTLLEVREEASKLGISLTGVKCRLDELQQLDSPAIIHLKGDHFLVLDRVSGAYARVYDREPDPVIRSRAELEELFSGNALVASEALSPAHTTARARADTYIIDVGAGRGGAITRSFSLQTEGGTPVRVLETQTCCGTVVEPSGSWELVPGRKQEVKVTCLVPRPIPGKESVFDKTVTLVLDAPEWRVINLTITGRVGMRCRPVPEIADFGKVRRGGVVTKEIRLVNCAPELAECARFDVSSDSLKVDKKDYDTGAGILTLALALDTRELRGRVRESISIYAGPSAESPRVTITALAEVSGDVLVKPGVLFLGLVEKGRMASAKVRLARTDRSPLTILDVRAPSGIAVHWGTDGDACFVEATVGPEILFDTLDDHLVVITDVDSDREVRIPIYAARES